MATSTESKLFSNLTYNDEIKANIIASGGTIIFIKDNVIVASEISEFQYRELLKSSLVEKLDVLPLKRYGDESVKYTLNEKSNEFQAQNITPPKPISTQNSGG